MRTLRPLVLLGLLPLACGGGGGSGYAGDYQMVEITTRANCAGDPMPVEIQATEEFFQLSDEEFFGADVIGWHTCAARGQCEMDWSLFDSFVEEGGQWRNGFFAWGGNPCLVTSERGVLTRLDDATIQITVTRREGEVPELDCSMDVESAEVEPYVDDLPCVEETVKTATAL